MDTSRDKVLAEVIEKAGGVSALAKQIGRTAGAVSQWRRVPHQYVLKCELLTGVSRYKQRPDVFGKAPTSKVA